MARWSWWHRWAETAVVWASGMNQTAYQRDPSVVFDISQPHGSGIMIIALRMKQEFTHNQE